MSSTMNGTRWGLGHGGWGCMAFWLGIAAASATSCLDANDEHCLFRGGDSACDAGICLFASAGGRADGVGEDGCFDPGEVDDVDEAIPAGFFHAKYGLPEDPELLQSKGVDRAQVEALEQEGVFTVGESFDSSGCQARKKAFDLDLGGLSSCEARSENGSEAELTTAAQRLCDYYDAIDEATPQPDTDTGTDTDAETVDDTATTDETTGSSSDTGPVCPSECTDPMRPVCDPTTGMCVLCADADPEQPLPFEGECVQCTAEDATICTTQNLLCDDESHTCVPCTEHEQCAVGACALAEGTCFPPGAMVLQVDGQDSMGVEAAVSAVPAGGVGVIVVPALESGGEYGPVIADGGKTIALLAAPGEQPILRGTVGNPGLRVEGAGTVVYMEGLTLANNASDLGLRVTGATAWVDRSRIVQNTGGGIVAEMDMVAEIRAVLTLRNSFVSTTGNGISAVVIADSDASIIYSTMFSSAFAPTAALSCNGSTNGSLSNSIVVTEGGALGDEMDCLGIDSTYSATEALLPGEGNVSTNAFPDGSPDQWFTNVTVGDLGLQNEGVTIFADVARWHAGDPTIDIDGDDRPSTDGSLDYAGADVP